jgi:hypothetical protein
MAMQMIGIQKTLEVFDDLGGLAVAGIGIAKSGISLGSLMKIAEIIKNAKELIEDVPQALPELMDLDAMEASKVGQASYMLVKRILDAVKA